MLARFRDERVRPRVRRLGTAWNHEKAARLEPGHAPSEDLLGRSHRLGDHQTRSSRRELFDPSEARLQIRNFELPTNGPLKMVSALPAIDQDHGELGSRDRDGSSGKAGP